MAYLCKAPFKQSKFILNFSHICLSASYIKDQKDDFSEFNHNYWSVFLFIIRISKAKQKLFGIYWKSIKMFSILRIFKDDCYSLSNNLIYGFLASWKKYKTICQLIISKRKASFCFPISEQTLPLILLRNKKLVSNYDLKSKNRLTGLRKKKHKKI